MKFTVDFFPKLYALFGLEPGTTVAPKPELWRGIVPTVDALTILVPPTMEVGQNSLNANAWQEFITAAPGHRYMIRAIHLSRASGDRDLEAIGIFEPGGSAVVIVRDSGATSELNTGVLAAALPLAEGWYMSYVTADGTVSTAIDSRTLFDDYLIPT